MDEIIYLKIDQLAPNPMRSRVSFPHDFLVKLSDSIRKHGVLNPILVALTPIGYQIISGERRWRAAKLAGLSEIPAVVKKVAPEEVLLLSLVENLHHEPLTVFEQASSIERLRSHFGLSLQEIGERLGLSVEEINKRLSVLKLSDKVKNEILSRRITNREVLLLVDKETEREVYQEVMRKSKYTF